MPMKVYRSFSRRSEIRALTFVNYIFIFKAFSLMTLMLFTYRRDLSCQNNNTGLYLARGSVLFGANFKLSRKLTIYFHRHQSFTLIHLKSLKTSSATVNEL